MKVKRRKKSILLSLCFLLLFTGFSGVISPNVQAAPVEPKERYLIRLKDSSSANKWASRKGFESRHSAKSEKRSSIVAELSSSDLAKLKADSEVLFVEKDQPLSLSATNEDTPSGSRSIVPWGITATQAVYAHNEGMTGDGINIAILDTGVSTAHPDLRIAGGQTFVDGSLNYEDDNGHGTLVTGVINGIPNAYGIEGMAPDANIYALKVLDANGNGFYSSVIEAIDWCVENGIQIVSMSFGGTEYSEILQQVIREATVEHGLLFVAAAGNNGAGEETEAFPARYSDVISVGSVNASYTRSVFSSTGAQLDIMAPGEQIWSTAIGGDYGVRSGTSMAAPYAAGAAALVWSANRAWSADQVRTALLEQAVPLGDRHEYGAGLLQVVLQSTPQIDPETHQQPAPHPEAPPVIQPEYHGELISISQEEYEVRVLIEKLARMQETALSENNIALSKDIDNAYNQLKIQYLVLRQPTRKDSLAKTSYPLDAAVTSRLTSVTSSVYETQTVHQSVYSNEVQPQGISALLADYMPLADTFQDQIGGEGEKSAIAPMDYTFSGKIGDGQSINPGETATVYFSMVTDVKDLDVQITGPDYYFEESYQVPDENYWGFNMYHWYTDPYLAPGDYYIKFICHYPQSSDYFEIEFRIYVGIDSMATSLSRGTPVDIYSPDYGTAMFSYHSSDKFENLRIRTFQNGDRFSDTTLYIYADSSKDYFIDYNNDSEGSLYATVELILKPNSTIFIEVKNYYQGRGLYAGLTVEAGNYLITSLSSKTPVDRSLPSLTAGFFEFSPTKSEQITLKTGPYGGNGGDSDTMLYLYGDANHTQLLAEDDDSGGSHFSEITANVVAGRTYYVALTGWGRKSVYARLSLTGSGDSTPPTPPSQLIMTSRTASSATLEWKPATDDIGVVYYDIYRSGSYVASVPSSSLTYKVTGLSANYLHTFTVKARDAAGNLSGASNKTAFLYINGSVTYQYDSTGRLSGIRLPSGQVITYQKDNNGNTKGIILP